MPTVTTMPTVMTVSDVLGLWYLRVLFISYPWGKMKEDVKFLAHSTEGFPD